MQPKCLWSLERCQKSGNHPLNDLTKIVLMPFGAWSHKTHLSILITFLHQKISIILCTKDTSVFHLKSGDNLRLHHFLTFTPSKHTSHQHDQSIANCQFFTYKYGWPITGGRLWIWKDFTVTLNQLMSCHLSFSLNFTPEREIEYKKLVNAIFLEVFNRQKLEKQIAIIDFLCVAKLKKAHERSIVHI